MLICKNCIVRHGWFAMRHGDGDCEICWDRSVPVYDVERPIKVDVSMNPSFEELGKVVDKSEAFYYYTQCENLFIYFRKGVRAGQIDYDTTEKFLKPINVIINDVQDWKATYKRRLRAKQSYQLTEERIRG